MNKWGDISRLIQRYFVNQNTVTQQKVHKQSYINTIKTKLNILFGDHEVVNTCHKKKHNESSS